MLEMKSVTKTFGDFKALEDLTMTVPKGAVYGLVGPNGAGKSTAIRILTGVYRQDKGDVLMENTPIYENPTLKARIGYIPDDIFYFPSATMDEMRRFYKGMYPNFDNDLYNRLFEVFQLPRRGQIRRFSKGMQKQAAFHLAICTRPDVMILDEPVDGLDPVMRRQVWSLILSDVAQRGTTVLVSSHNLRELEDVCDHVGILSHGKVLLERSLSDLQDNLVKLQVVFPTAEKPALPADLEVLHESNLGRVYTLIVRGNPAVVKSRMAVYQPILLEALPLSLEEIFIYELGGEDYAVRDIVL
jgi:ABC-2 type transport system ATP-binding protein